MAFLANNERNNYNRVEASILVYDDHDDILNQGSVQSIKNYFNEIESKKIDDRVDNSIDATNTTNFTGRSIGIKPSINTETIEEKYDKFNQRFYDGSDPRRFVFEDNRNRQIKLNSIFTLTRLFLLILFIFIMVDFVRS